MARPGASRFPRTVGFARDVRPGPGSDGRQGRQTEWSPQTPSCVHGAPQMRAVWLHDDGGEKEGQIRLSPLHGIQRRLRERIRPGGDVGRLARRGHQADALCASDGDAESQRAAAVSQAENRRRTVVSKLDRGYEDFVSDRISEGFWTRKSEEWEAELQTIDAERARLKRLHVPAVATAEKILELATKAEILYKSQNPGEQRRLLETVLSNCTFDRGSLKPTYTSPFDLLVKGNETGNWRAVWDEFRNWAQHG